MTAKPNSCWRNNDLNFTESRHDACSDRFDGLSREYRTVFGPFFPSNSKMILCDNSGLRGAVRRLTCVREPGIAGLHEELEWNQRHLGYLHDDIALWAGHLKRELGYILSSKLDAEQERNLWTEQPHVKKKLRIQTRLDIHARGHDHRTRVAKVRYKCKPGELLKRDKYPRAVGDLTCPGSTMAGYYFDWVKEAFAHRYTMSHGFLQFLKTPSLLSLREVFENILNPEGLVFYYFSDDSILSYPCSDGVFMANMDISACDGSNFQPIFDMLRDAVDIDPRYSHDVEGAFAQCKLPCVAYSCDFREKVTFTPNESVLYSGSVMTTSVNNMANTTNGISINHELNALDHRPTKAEFSELVVRATHRVGYIVKVEECLVPGELQFLKYSPAVVDGVVVPYLNLGVWMRGFGHCKGDVPGSSRTPMSERMSVYNSEIVRSRCHAGNHRFHQAFRTHVTDRRAKINIDYRIVSDEVGIQTWIPNEHLCQRYGITLDQFDELIENIESMTLGSSFRSAVTDRIYAVDYGF